MTPRAADSTVLSDAEAERIAARLRSFGYAVDRIPESDHPTADLRAHDEEHTLVIEVKSRGRRPDFDGPDDHWAAQTVHLDRSAEHEHRRGSKQVEASRREGESGGVWFVMPESTGRAADAESLVHRLLGMRHLSVDRERMPVFAVHPPKFRRSDFVVVESASGATTLLLNPWSERSASLAGSSLARGVDRIYDPDEEVKNGRAWYAPKPTEAVRLGECYRAKCAALGMPKKDPMRVPRRSELEDARRQCRREFQVTYALMELHPESEIGSFWSDTSFEAMFRTESAPAGDARRGNTNK